MEIWVTTKDAAHIARVTQRHMRRVIAEQAMRTIRIGWHTSLVRWADVAAWLEKRDSEHVRTV